MFLIYFLIPLFLSVIGEVPKIKAIGVRKELQKISFWLKLFSTEVFANGMMMILFMDFGAPLQFSVMKLLASVLSSLFFLLLWHGTGKTVKGTSWKRALVFCALIAVFLEATLFNFRFYQSFEYEKIDLSDDLYISRQFLLVDGEENIYKPNKNTTPYIEINDIDTKIYNVYVDVVAKDASGAVVNTYVTAHITDRSNENAMKLPAQTIMSDVESTKYLYVLTNGESDYLRLDFATNYAKTYQIHGIYLNTPQPLRISPIRMLGVFAILFLFWVMRPRGRFFQPSFTDSFRQRVVTTIVILAEILLLLGITFMNPAFAGNPSRHTSQYQKLAESFMEGQLYLEEEPPEFLAEMENPYDRVERENQIRLHGESVHWDAAYFEGRYYVYFGVLPVLMLYLPFQMFTGAALPNLFAIQFYLCLFVVGSFLLIARIIKKYFSHRKIPYLSYLILSLIFVNASGGIFIAKRPDFYSVPIISALALTVFGLYFWMLAEDNGRVRPGIAFVGSLCMALVAACRPQLLLGSALIFVIYWNAVFKDRSVFSQKGWKATVALILPYLIVAAGLMWYNYARFGSPFDFGANYNLTTNDMTGRGYRMERVGLSIFTYFFQFPNITAAFPFVQSTTIATNYLGTTITEPMFGGIFMVIPLLWCLCLLPSRWRAMNQRGLLAFCLVPLLLSLVIGVFDAQGAGLLQRYVSDFAFLACFGAIFFICFLYEKVLLSKRERVNAFLRFALFASGAYCFFIIFAKYSVEIFYYNPYLFNYVSELVQFW